MAKVGDRGLSVNLIAKHLYNLNSSLFFTPNIEDIKRYVRTFLAKNSQTANSIILKMDKKGCYKLNPNTPAVHQLMIDFSVHNSWMMMNSKTLKSNQTATIIMIHLQGSLTDTFSLIYNVFLIDSVNDKASFLLSEMELPAREPPCVHVV